jgi:hypothetical protein
MRPGIIISIFLFILVNLIFVIAHIIKHNLI